ncbi:protein O-GlcNAc transferase [Handroanthus impetiginosus]|uniref:Protein O-GlcNAc transferase n=1 Tax=Handroanthus impetiginosus TaxID=429701 RepID=A0A2G9HEW3_9LAMI|nr:protein O-GlcNAc transferase [Handroanthus impetiginosus]
MVKYQRKNLYGQWKKSKDFMVDEDEESSLNPFGLICGNSVSSYKRAKPKFLYIVFLSLLSCSLLLAPLFLSFHTNFSLLCSFGANKEGLGSENAGNGFLCSSVPNGTICCDRSSVRSDICIMRGDVRTNSDSSSVILYRSSEVIQQEKIRPYTRKWETSVMNTIDELNLIVKKDSSAPQSCDVQHEVPAVFFSNGGYTGNLYQEFNDGILPLYITSQQMNKKVVFVILEYHNWWITKYGDILSQLSDYPPIDFSRDKRIHCFPEAIIGLRIHNELTIDASLMENNKTIGDFQDVLDRAYWPRIRGLILDEKREIAMSPSSVNAIVTKTAKRNLDKPKVVIVSRNGSRAIMNEDSLVKIAEDIGFTEEVLRPERTTELAKIYRVLNSSDVMVGVHGAAMTHFLFMKPGSVFIQVIPLGTEWAAETYYGEPAKKFGLRYIGYKILPSESSLYDDYDKNDPILVDPSSVNSKGWEFTKKIYLDRQNVKLDLRRFQKRLLRAYYYSKSRKNGRLRYQSQ